MSIIPPAAVLSKRERQRMNDVSHIKVYKKQWTPDEGIKTIGVKTIEIISKPKEESLTWQNYNEWVNVFSWCDECGILTEHNKIHLCGVDLLRSHQERNALLRNSLNAIEIDILKEQRSSNNPPELNDKYQCMGVEYPDSKKHIGLLYDPCNDYQSITRKREIVKNMMDKGLAFTEWYCAPVLDLARELGLIDEIHCNADETPVTSLTFANQQAVLTTPDIEKRIEVVDDFKQTMMMSIDQCAQELLDVKAKLDYQAVMQSHRTLYIGTMAFMGIVVFMIAYCICNLMR